MKRFSTQEDDFIRDNYLELSLNEMGEKLGRSFGSVYGRMKCLGLKVPNEVKTERFIKSYRKLAEAGKANRFVKGHVPPNKGVPMSPEVYEKCAKTMFKKGNVPHTQVHNGQPYLYTRQRRNGYTEKLWFIQEGTNKRSAYLAYLCRQNGIDLTGKKPILKPGFSHLSPPTIDANLFHL